MIGLLWVLSAYAAPVEVQSWLQGAPEAGQVVVQVSAPSGAGIDLPEPAAEGLDFREVGEATVEEIGKNEVITRRFAYTGAKGSYRIAPLSVTWEGQTAEAPALYLDLGVAPPGRGEIAEIEDPPPIYGVPWALLGGGALVLGGGAAIFAGTRRKGVPVAPPEVALAPDEAALRGWDAARGAARGEPMALAVAASRALRVYLEAVLAFPAESATTPEVLEHLWKMPHLPEDLAARVKRVLRASDRVKYAELPPGDAFERELDGDLRAVIAAFSPRRRGEG